jgi:hypothetical protein
MLNPHYVCGFVDGEGCFCVSISRKRFRVPEIKLRFEIEVREDDEPILREIQQKLGCGYIYYLDYERYKKWRPHAKYVVGSFRDIYEKVIPFFKEHPLQAKKKKQFEFFAQVVDMMARFEHRNPEGVEKIRALRESFRYRDSLDARDGHVQWGGE